MKEFKKRMIAATWGLLVAVLIAEFAMRVLNSGSGNDSSFAGEIIRLLLGLIAGAI